MATNTSLKFSLLILLSVLTIIKSQDQWIVYTKGKGFTYEEPNAPQQKRFAIEFNDPSNPSYDGPLYMKVEVTAPEGILYYVFPMMILIVSPGIFL